MKERRTFTVTASDRWPLTVESVEAAGRPVGVAMCGHAMMCDRRTLDRPRGAGLASVLAEAGFETYLADLRGHGDSGRGRRDSAQVTYDDHVLRDIPALLKAAQRRHPGLPVILVGHSLTAHTGLAAIGLDATLPVRAVVSLAGNVWLRRLEPSRRRWLIKHAIIEAWWAVARVAGGFPARRLRVGTDDVAFPTIDQYIRFVRHDQWGSADGQHDYLAALSHLTIPILDITSTADRWMCNPTATRLFLAHTNSAPVTHRVVGERPGDPTAIDHMGIATDEAMRPIWQEIAGWMRAICER